jgi:pimeloyl-ACP methyl ester carboxylesterase
LPQIATPVLVLAGKEDPIVPPPNGQLLADLMPHCRHTLLDGGHLIWEDAAEAYSSHLGEWLTKGYRAVSTLTVPLASLDQQEKRDE